MRAVGVLAVALGGVGAALQQVGKLPGLLLEQLALGGVARHAHDDAGGVQVVVKGVALAQELRREQEAALGVTLAQALGIAHGHRGLHDHDGSGVDLEHELHDLLDIAGVEEVARGVVVGGGGDHDKLGLLVGSLAVHGGSEGQRALPRLCAGQEALNLLVADGALPALEHGDLLRHDVHSGNVIVLRQKARQREPDVAGACDCDVH